MSRWILFFTAIIYMNVAFSSDADWSNSTTGEISFKLPKLVLNYFTKSKKAGDSYRIYTEMNPMYIRLDINGDGKQEYALIVKNEDKDALGILIIYSESKADLLFTDIPVTDLLYNEKVDDLTAYDIDFWYASEKRVLTQKAEADKPPMPTAETITIGRSESYESNILWNGSTYVTY